MQVARGLVGPAGLRTAHCDELTPGSIAQTTITVLLAGPRLPDIEISEDRIEVVMPDIVGAPQSRRLQWGT